MELILIGSLPVILGIGLVVWSVAREPDPADPARGMSYDDFMKTCTDDEYLEHVKHCKVHFYHPYLNYLAGKRAR